MLRTFKRTKEEIEVARKISKKLRSFLDLFGIKVSTFAIAMQRDEGSMRNILLPSNEKNSLNEEDIVLLKGYLILMQGQVTDFIAEIDALKPNI